MAALTYVLSFEGAASPTLRAAFTEFELEVAAGVTSVRCPPDRLHVVLALVQDLGLEVLEVRSHAWPDDEGGASVR